MVIIFIMISILVLQESWQKVRILELVDVMEDPVLLKVYEDYNDAFGTSKRSLGSVSRSWRWGSKRLYNPHLNTISKMRSVRNRYIFIFSKHLCEKYW